MTEIVKSTWADFNKALSEAADTVTKCLQMPGVQLYLFVMISLILLSSGDLAKLLRWSAMNLARVLVATGPRLSAALKRVKSAVLAIKARM